VGDNSEGDPHGGQQADRRQRQGAVKKRSQLKTKPGGAAAWTKRNKKGWGVHGGKKAGQEEKGSREVQGCATREVLI
jgi:hypothetical protein